MFPFLKSTIGFRFLIIWRFLCRFRCRRRASAGGAAAFDLWFCGPLAAAGPRAAPPAGRPPAACRRGFRCTRATPRLKPLRFWALGCMHWLMWTVTRFRFLSWSEGVAGRRRQPPAGASRLYLHPRLTKHLRHVTFILDHVICYRILYFWNDYVVVLFWQSRYDRFDHHQRRYSTLDSVSRHHATESIYLLHDKRMCDARILLSSSCLSS